ncbi:hypothetical protein HK098_006349 [Nowakowskiella sp. JEL0407]|nr:hypothetical protein HK098_006349 [Nowakowskiella sp. JEL0407]
MYYFFGNDDGLFFLMLLIQVYASLVDLFCTTRIAFAIFKTLKRSSNANHHPIKSGITLSIFSIVLLDTVAYSLISFAVLIPELEYLSTHLFFIAATTFAFHIFIGLSLLKRLKGAILECGESGIELAVQGSETVVDDGTSSEID